MSRIPNAAENNEDFISGCIVSMVPTQYRTVEECVINQSAETRHTQILGVIFVSFKLNSATNHVGPTVNF
jgi:hypothetical protein